jgi:hypothetical protein
MGNFCLTDEYPEARNQLVTDNEKPRPMGIKGRGQLGVDVPVDGNALRKILSLDSPGTIPGFGI